MSPPLFGLVLACDLPFLTEHTLEHLIAHRDASKIATAYRSAHDGLPEPLCAIWEPSSREPLQAYLDTGKQCPRKFLINANTLLLDLPQARALDNINTTDEFDAASAALRGADDDARSTSAGDNRSLRVQYFALFREQAGRSEEMLDTPAATPGDLYRELQTRYPFKLAREQLKVAINDEFSAWDARLKNGDTIVFIPPVAGG